MDTLFNDSEVFTKERPKKLTPKQKHSLMLELAKEVKESRWSSDSIEDIADDLGGIYGGDNGYDIAKDLDDFSSNASYDIDSSFVEWLDGFCWNEWQEIEKFEKQWVKAHSIEPKFKHGSKLVINIPLNRHLKEFQEGEIVFVNGNRSETAKYYISTNKSDKRNTVFDYERIEERCTLIDGDGN